MSPGSTKSGLGNHCRLVLWKAAERGWSSRRSLGQGMWLVEPPSELSLCCGGSTFQVGGRYHKIQYAEVMFTNPNSCLSRQDIQKQLSVFPDENTWPQPTTTCPSIRYSQNEDVYRRVTVDRTGVQDGRLWIPIQRTPNKKTAKTKFSLYVHSKTKVLLQNFALFAMKTYGKRTIPIPPRGVPCGQRPLPS